MDELKRGQMIPFTGLWRSFQLLTVLPPVTFMFCYMYPIKFRKKLHNISAGTKQNLLFKPVVKLGAADLKLNHGDSPWNLVKCGQIRFAVDCLLCCLNIYGV